MKSIATPASQPPTSHSEAFRFVNELAQALSRGKVELPAIPDVAAKVRRALEDEKVSAERIERIVSAEPVLATRIVTLANSAALNMSGNKVSDLRTAIARVGFSMVRTTSMAFALAQLRKGAELRGLEVQLSALWRRSTMVAAMARVVSARISRVNPDTAMFTGLLHGIGELYILTRIGAYPVLANTDEGKGIVRDWHGSVAKAILENWDIDPLITEAVADFQTYDREHVGAVDLTDVLTVSFLLASYTSHPESLELNMADVGVCRKLQLSQADYQRLMEESREQMEALREALDF
jgi:HD-like signal output (HDOD) protein